MAQTKNIDIIPNDAIKRVHVSQGDIGRTIYFNLYEGSLAYTPTSGDVITCVGTKPSGLGFTVTCTWSGNVVTCVTTEGMTDESGSIETELVITNSTTVLGTSNFVLVVEKNPHPDGTTDGRMETLIPELTLLVNEVKSYAEEIEDTYHAYGSPWVASTASEMTDTSKIYVYTGSETGYTNGNWYYYNGSAWVSGGVYNSVAVSTDTTLTQSGVSADAKAVGDSIADLANVTMSDGKSTSELELGAINGGVEASNTARARTTDYIPVYGGTMTLSIPSGYYAYICEYDANKTYLTGVGWKSDGDELSTTSFSYVRLVFKNSSGSTLSDDDLTTLASFYITETSLEYDELKAHDDVDDLKETAQIFINRPNVAYIEQTNTASGSVYIHFDGNIAVRVIANVTESISALATEIETTLVTSPNGVENCIAVADETCLVFNTDTNTFGIVARASISNEMIVVISCSGGKVVRALPSFVFDAIYSLTSDINDLEAELGNSYIADSVNSVVNNMANQNGNCLNLAFITDLHFNAFGDDVSEQTEIWERNSNGLTAINKLRNIDFTILGGDYLWNNSTLTTLARAKNAYAVLQKVFYQHKDKLFALKGNHDDNSLTSDVSKLITDDVRYGYLGQQYTNDVTTNYGDIEKSYGYIDFKRQKVRVIFVNTVDIPYDDNLTYKGQTVKGIGNEQLNFIADALQFSENGWGVVFFSHHALVDNSGINPNSDSDVYVTSTHGGDAIWGIIQAFTNNSTYAVTSTLTDFEYSVNVDYTSNASNEVIACINGHTHKDLSGVQNDVLLITTTASGFGVNAYDSEGTLISRTVNTASETSFDIFSIDRINRTVTASRYGAGQNRSWSL